MNRGRVALLVAALATVAVLVLPARPAAANHDSSALQVTIAINAAGNDRLAVTDDTYDSTSYVTLASDVAVALGRAPGSYRASEDFVGADVEIDGKLAEPDARGGLSYALDTGRLQLLAQNEGYEAVSVEVCTPRVRQVYRALVAPESLPMSSPGTRCRGWYQMVDDPAIQAEIQLSPSRERFPRAVVRIVGAAAVTFGLLGIGATLLRRGPLRRRSLASWLVAAAAAVVVAPLGWGVATFALWWAGTPSDPVMLSGGSVGEQVARTLLPGVIFVLPALFPAAILLTVARRERASPPPRPAVPVGPPAMTWWPTAWWPQWAAQNAGRVTYPQVDAPPAPSPPRPQDDAPGPAVWAPPGSGAG